MWKNQQSHSIFKAPRLREAGNTGTHPILVHEFQEGCCINALLHRATQAFANEPILLQLRIMTFPTSTNGSVNCSSLPSELTLELEGHSHFFWLFRLNSEHTKVYKHTHAYSPTKQVKWQLISGGERHVYKARVECLQAFLFLLLMFYVSLSFCLSFFLNARVLLMYDRVLLDWLLTPNKLVSDVFVSLAKTGFRNLVLPTMLTNLACPMPETSTNKLGLYPKNPKI